MKAGKVWGTTELIEANGALELHRIEMEAGGVCSKHLHRYKWNGFYVMSGEMKIRVWSGVAYELYWAEFNHNDIVREEQGFMGNV